MPCPKAARVVSGSSSPHGQSRSSPPRAAASHSISVGSRTPFEAQNASASARETYVRGTPPSPVTGTRLIRNASTGTTRRGVSSSSGGYATAGSIPIANGPAGIGTHSIME
jgi:hypothetical protein